jgi:hypothetical protein
VRGNLCVEPGPYFFPRLPPKSLHDIKVRASLKGRGRIVVWFVIYIL